MGIDYKGTLDGLVSKKSMLNSVASNIAMNQIYAMSLIRKFYAAWAAGQSSEQVWATLPEDDPNTLPNEEVTDLEFVGMVEKYLDRQFEPGVLPAPDVLLQEANIESIEAKVRELLGQKLMVENQARSVDFEIKSIEALQKADTASESSDPEE